ncbi:DUF1345 domain-containing protein [Paenarthrobacter nitroguajacolicus]|uniref:DUF1345 domain-containing protein n=1 Tax=Paenarthrobacter nitroguajacolicus TaxID=211146 RepID=UPI00211955B3|nr:DUF1345 domain-containing protein [Paenarthrobacter nitroguajacolicus]
MHNVRVKRSRLRFVVMVLAGASAFAVTGALSNWVDAPAVGWAVAALVYVAWVWLVIARLDPVETRHHATSEDPSRGVTDVLILIANLASLAAVAAVIVDSHTQGTGARLSSAALALACMGLSWMLVQTLFTLRYAELYYSQDGHAGGEVGGINFNQDRPPQYTDFAYLATSLGMTYQVSDTNLGNHTIRLEALKHSLLSYLFGTVILAVTINLVIGLAQ